MAAPTDSTTGRGRPRSDRADEAILAATLDLLAEHGYGGLTTDRIAHEAGVSKATIYRRWSSKDEVVLAAVRSLATDVPAPDTGSLHEDLTILVRWLASVFSRPSTARLISALVEPIARNPTLAVALRHGFLRARRSTVRTAMQRGRDRGEVRTDIDLDVAVDLLAAPFYYRVLITGEPVDEDLARRLVDATLAWISSDA